ncbi:MAG: hypothetical protein ABI876_17265 [Bacteroidota bacterium]
MKRQLPLALFLMVSLLALAGCGSFQATKSMNVMYDMANNNFSVSPGGGMAVNEGDMVSFQLTNINPFVYDVSINNKAIVYNTTLPQPIRLPFHGADLVDTITETTIINVNDGGRINVAAVSHFRENYSGFRTQYTKFYGFLLFDDYLYSTLRQPFIDEKQLKEQIQSRLSQVTGGTKMYGRNDFIMKGEEIYSTVSKSYNDLLSEYQILDTASKRNMSDIMKSATRAYNDLAKGAWMTKVTNTADMFDQVQNTSFSFSSFKVQASGDVVNFAIDGRRKGETNLPTYDVKPFNLDYNVKVNGGWKIDASAGLFLSSLVNESFTTRLENGEQIILKKKGDVLNYGPGALMHFYYQPWGIGTNLGIFTNTFSNIQFLFGPSLLLGDNKFCLNGGVTMGKVTRLADGYAVGGTLDTRGSVAVAVPTSDRLDLGWFVGFSYNFTNGLRK